MSDWLTKRSPEARRRQIEHLIWLRKNDPLYKAQYRLIVTRSKIRLRWAAIKAYGSKCKCCGESQPQFLCIDHVDGGGNKHRKSGMRGYRFYCWLRDNKYPKGFRVLCHNCNFALSAYGRCPHKSKAGGAEDAKKIRGENEVVIPSAAGRANRGGSMKEFKLLKHARSRGWL